MEQLISVPIDSTAEARLPYISDDNFVGRCYLAKENAGSATLSNRTCWKLASLRNRLCESTFISDGRSDRAQRTVAL